MSNQRRRPNRQDEGLERETSANGRGSVLRLQACWKFAGLGGTVVLAFSRLLAGEFPQVDKSAYHLFNRTPNEYLRDFATDRPDKTESAYTVDAGHFQIEFDAAAVAFDADRGARSDEFNFFNANIKVGLLNHVDLQLVVPAYNILRTSADGTKSSDGGFGDIETRLKINLWGNDHGPTALALMPFVKWPTAAREIAPNRAVEGGLILPLAIELPKGFGLGLQTEVDFARNDSDAGYHVEYVNSVTIGHDLVGNLAAYLEFWSLVSGAAEPWQGSVDVGFTYGIGTNIQLDFGVNFGITRSAPNYQPFAGLSWRY